VTCVNIYNIVLGWNIFVTERNDCSIAGKVRTQYFFHIYYVLCSIS